MIIIKANSLEEANEIAHSDPFVKSGVRSCEVLSWQISVFPGQCEKYPSNARSRLSRYFSNL